MYTRAKKMMKKISNVPGERVDYIQGGGENTSVKFDDKLMAIKASGYTLKQMTEDVGYVTVDYTKIRKYYNEVDETADKDFEKESLAVNMDSIVLLEGMEEKRPSVEVGFHAFMGKCVIHTHSVYANIICCAKERRQLAKDIFGRSDISYTFVPYINPGFLLALTVKRAFEAYKEENGFTPKAIFMENHGVIVCDDDPDKAIAIHENLNNMIVEHFNLGSYEPPKIKETGDGFVSDTKYLKDWIGGKEAFLRKLSLYPDQLIYVTKNFDGVVKINESERAIEYAATENKAMVIEETLLGAIYVVNEIEKAGLTLSQMSEKETNFINNWESEAYRSKLVK